MKSLHERYALGISHLCYQVVNIQQQHASVVSTTEKEIDSLIQSLKLLLAPATYDLLISASDEDRKSLITNFEDLEKCLRALDLNQLISSYPKESELIVQLVEEVVEMFDDVSTSNTLTESDNFKTIFESLDC